MDRMAGVDLNRIRARVETEERRPERANEGRMGARTGSRQRGGAAVVTSTPKRTNAFWFFVALSGGGTVIWWTKAAFADAWLAAMVAAGVVLALAVYYVLNDEDAPEEEGDNVYYLGLLFTLISLMIALVELFGGEADGVRSPNDIHVLLESFGIALTSTVVGIASRVAVQNWQRSASAARSELAEDTVVPAHPPAGASSRDLEKFNRALLEKITRDHIRGANALARFHRIVRSHASDTESYLLSHSEALIRESAEFKDTLQRNAETFAQELKNEAKNTLDAVGGSLDAAAKQAEALPERLRSAHDAYLAEVREVTRSFHDDLRSASSQSLDTLRQSFDSAAKSTTVLEVEVDKLRAALAAVHSGVEAMRGTLDAMGELDARIRAGRDTEQAAAVVRQIGETLQTIATEAAAATERTVKAAELFDALARNVQTTEDETRRAAEALRVLADEAETRVETLRRRESSGWRFWNRSR